jgi:hypothetical protein
MILSRFVGAISGARLSPVFASITSSGTPTAPTITTSTSAVDANQLLLAGTFSGTTSRYFEYGASSGSLNSTLTLTNSQTSKTLSGLDDSETVYFRAVGENNSYTRTISGTINPNYFSTTVTFTYGLQSNLSDGTTITVGTFTGSTAQAFSTTRPGVTGTTYYYRFSATNIFTTVQSSIGSYVVSSPTVTNGVTRNQTTAAAQPTPSLLWENTDTDREGNFRLYVNVAANTTYQVKSSSSSSGPFGSAANMTITSGQARTGYLNPTAVASATTYTYYRVTATDQYGRTKNSNVRGVAPIDLRWGADVGGDHIEGQSDASVATGTFNISFPGENESNTVTLASFLGLTRFRVTSVRWDVTVSPGGLYITNTQRRLRFYYLTGWQSRFTGFDDDIGSNSYTDDADFPSSTTWTTSTLNFGGGDMPVSGSPSKYSDGTISSWSGSTEVDGLVTVNYLLQTFASITDNSTTLYVNFPA